MEAVQEPYAGPPDALGYNPHPPPIRLPSHLCRNDYVSIQSGMPRKALAATGGAMSANFKPFHDDVEAAVPLQLFFQGLEDLTHELDDLSAT